MGGSVKTQVFTLLNDHHINALVFVVIISTLVPVMIRFTGSDDMKVLTGKWLGYLLLFNEATKPFFRYFLFGESWNMVLPLHLCHISAIMTGFVLITQNRPLFGIVYFWAFGGTPIALMTPDLAFTFPDAQFIMFFITHGFIVLGALYVTIVYQYRPTWKSLWSSFKISLIIMMIIFPLNYTLGGATNYLYLRFKPQVGSIMDFLPDSPLHIPFVVLLGLITFVLVYLPYAIRDGLGLNKGE